MALLNVRPLAGVVLAGACCFAQADTSPRVNIEPRQRATLPLAAAPEIRAANFRMDVKLIQIPVTVTDMRDHAVMGLGKPAFKIFEDDVEQEIATFSMGDAPVSAGVVFDASGSMRNHMGESREAVGQFLKTCSPSDQIFLVRFSDNPQLTSPLTNNCDQVERDLSGVQPRGWTALNDAIMLSMRELKKASNPRRALLVFSDGVDNNSRYSDGELLSVMREAGAPVFAIGLFEKSRFLEKLTDETGGRVIWVKKVAELPDAMEKLSVQIRNQYVLGYFSDHAKNDGRYHKIRVEVQPQIDTPPLRVSWRRGYSAP